MGIDYEALIVPGLLAAAAAWAFIVIIAGRAELNRSFIEVCAKAVEIRAEQERLAAAGKPAPFLVQARRAESDVRDVLGRLGL